MSFIYKRWITANTDTYDLPPISPMTTCSALVPDHTTVCTAHTLHRHVHPLRQRQAGWCSELVSSPLVPSQKFNERGSTLLHF